MLRVLGPLGLALVATIAVDQLGKARTLDPPGFADPRRRGLSLALLGVVLYLAVFSALGQIGLGLEPDLSAIRLPDLFALHLILLLGVGAWLGLAFGGRTGASSLPRTMAGQVGLVARRPLREIMIGLGCGLLTWPLLLVVVGSTVMIVFALGGSEVLPTEPPPLIVWIAALPVPAKLAIALSAGLVEELFFRGFLQPRVGVALSTLLFALAHLSYDQPFMLVGITLLSLFFAALVVWRQNIWAAVAAHFLFDATQLLFIIPWALSQWEDGIVEVAPVALVGAQILLLH